MYREKYHEIREVLETFTGEPDVMLSDGGEHADLASTVAFALAKKLRKPPHQIAQNLAKQLTEKIADVDVEIRATGPYINFTFGAEYVRDSIKNAVMPGYGAFPSRGVRVVLEHTSANPNGPLHVGHIRNTVIGDTLSRAFRKAGYMLEVQYYLNDMGRQIAIVTWGLERLGIDLEGHEKEDHYIARVYVAANRALRDDPSIVASIDERMRLVEQGERGTVEAFRTAVAMCTDGIKETLARLHAAHDRFVWESDFIRIGDVARTVDRIRRLPECHQDDTLWVDLTAVGIEKEYVLLRSDGTTVYSTRDLAYHIWKGRNFDLIIDVLGADHKLIGAQLTETLKLIGEKTPRIVHFEFVSLPEGSMSTRAGQFVSADELIGEVTAKALDEVTRRRTDLDMEARREIATAVAIAAIRYDIVKISPEKSTVFNWKEALDFERQSGPYIQYAHARACSILEKAGEFVHAFELETPLEIALAKLISRFPHVIETVVTELRPHLLASYARELADLFNTFYHHEPVLKSEGVTRNSRLTLVLAVQNTLNEALETMGIDALRSM